MIEDNNNSSIQISSDNQSNIQLQKYEEEEIGDLNVVVNDSETNNNNIILGTRVQEEYNDVDQDIVAKIPVVQSTPTPLPKMKMFAVFVVMLCDAINALSLFPYINFLVETFKLTDNEKKLGYYVGFLASSYYASQLFSSFFWGWFSNYKGRRPSVLIGIVGSMICMLCFGFSESYAWALMFRFLSGLVNGNVAVAKTMLGEITDSSNQARAFSFIGLSWSVGGITAPLIGGMFSGVCVSYPSLHFPAIICKYPYLLPNLICILFSIVGFILSYLYLAESKTFTIKYSKSSSNLGKNQKLKSFFGKSAGKIQTVLNILKSKSIKFIQIGRMDDEGSNIGISDGADNDMISPDTSVNNIDNIHYKSGDIEKKPMFSKLTMEEIELDKDEINQLDNQLEFQEEEEEDTSDNPRSVKELIKDKTVLYSCIIYALLGFMYTIWDEVFPVWSPIPRRIDPETGKPGGGGIGFNSKDIGIVQSTAGGFALIIQTFIFPAMAKCMGLVKSFKIALLISIPTWIILPELSRLTIVPVGSDTPPHPPLFWILLFPVYLCQSFASEISFVCSIVMISNSALPKDMALVNSIGMFLVSISRTIGPVIGSSLMAYSVSHNLPYPLDYHFIFVLLALFTIFLVGLSFILPKSLNYAKEEAIELEPIN